jgi:hypothetical protein
MLSKDLFMNVVPLFSQFGSQLKYPPCKIPVEKSS